MKRNQKGNSIGSILSKEATLKKLGLRIKELRIKNGFTNYEYFAYENGISRAQYGR